LDFKVFITFHAVLFLLACPARPQAESRPVFRVDTTVLQVDAVVLDSKGRQVTGLQADDFIVDEPGIYQVRILVRDAKTGLAGNAQCLVKAVLPRGKM
jgi:hypothetical protein